MEFSGRTWRPPYEQYTPIVEATAGCAWGRCTFCTLFCEERFSVGRLDRFERDLDEVKRFVPHARRLWLTGGSPFQMSFRQLEERAMAVWDRLIKCQSIAMFASVRDIARTSDEELRRLRALHVNGLAIGMESANDEVLELAGKGYGRADVLAQCRRLDAAGIEYNLIYLTGLAGRGRGRHNARTTAEVLNRLNPRILEISSLELMPGSELARRTAAGEFAPASAAERIDELRVLVEELQLRVHLEASSQTNPLRWWGCCRTTSPCCSPRSRRVRRGRALPPLGALPADAALVARCLVRAQAAAQGAVELGRQGALGGVRFLAHAARPACPCSGRCRAG